MAKWQRSGLKLAFVGSNPTRYLNTRRFYIYGYKSTKTEDLIPYEKIPDIMKVLSLQLLKVSKSLDLKFLLW